MDTKEIPITGCERILAERQRQILEEGWTAESDDDAIRGGLANAAACYAATSNIYPPNSYMSLWPWGSKWDKRISRPLKTGFDVNARIVELAKAGALCAAEIDRLLRLDGREAKAGPDEEPLRSSLSVDAAGVLYWRRLDDLHALAMDAEKSAETVLITVRGLDPVPTVGSRMGVQALHTRKIAAPSTFTRGDVVGIMADVKDMSDDELSAKLARLGIVQAKNGEEFATWWDRVCKEESLYPPSSRERCATAWRAAQDAWAQDAWENRDKPDEEPPTILDRIRKAQDGIKAALDGEFTTDTVGLVNAQFELIALEDKIRQRDETAPPDFSGIPEAPESAVWWHFSEIGSIVRKIRDDDQLCSDYIRKIQAWESDVLEVLANPIRPEQTWASYLAPENISPEATIKIPRAAKWADPTAEEWARANQIPTDSDEIRSFVGVVADIVEGLSGAEVDSQGHAAFVLTGESLLKDLRLWGKHWATAFDTDAVSLPEVLRGAFMAPTKADEIRAFYERTQDAVNSLGRAGTEREDLLRVLDYWAKFWVEVLNAEALDVAKKKASIKFTSAITAAVSESSLTEWEAGKLLSTISETLNPE